MSDDALKVLLVEDDSDDYAIFERMLSKIDGLQYDLEWRPSFAEGQTAIAENQYDVIFMDYRLGEYNGCELLQFAKENRCLAPIIFLSGECSSEIYKEIKKLGALNYLNKDEITPNYLAIAIDYAIEIAAQYERLKKIAAHDGLTNLLNHQEMYTMLTREIDRSRRYGTFLSMIMFDVDNFKMINDSYGHLVGDNVIRWLADLMRKSSRNVDINARYGGDEFVIILPDTKGQSALMKASHLCSAISKEPYTSYGQSVPVTISAGVAELCEGDTKEMFIEKADGALYLAKSRGRNCVYFK
ncbi:diguanylate cyclase (GGDEF domain) [hydrothermal vent metagenome]|uniref:Diguanylate cyclase (GGDEF domain) n=1 Tax=hydrothermal vent metagenome TaxID=652676 RepID=A0A3B1BUQ8_9ZZZZ